MSGRQEEPFAEPGKERDKHIRKEIILRLRSQGIGVTGNKEGDKQKNRQKMIKIQKGT